MRLRLQPVQIATGSDDQEGQLVFHGEFLVAVLVHLSDQEHGTEAGKWFLEAGFGPVESLNAPIFTDLDHAQSWITEQLS